jgi:hypothetical protein
MPRYAPSAVGAFAMLNSELDPATSGLDEAAGCVVLITASPTLVLMIFGRAPKTAPAPAFAFPSAFAHFDRNNYCVCMRTSQWKDGTRLGVSHNESSQPSINQVRVDFSAMSWRFRQAKPVLLSVTLRPGVVLFRRERLLTSLVSPRRSKLERRVTWNI